MGLIQSIFGYSEEVHQPVPRAVPLEGIAFISEEEAIVCGVKQRAPLQKIAEQLQLRGEHESSELPLEFAFHTNTKNKAAALVERLQQDGVEANYEVASQDQTLFLIQGKTRPTRMDAETLQKWTDRMCEFGYLYDAEMQSWEPSWKTLY